MSLLKEIYKRYLAEDDKSSPFVPKITKTTQATKTNKPNIAGMDLKDTKTYLFFKFDGGKGYSYEEALGWDKVPSEIAKKEVVAHGKDFSKFTREMGIQPTYSGQDILTWLGY